MPVPPGCEKRPSWEEKGPWESGRCRLGPESHPPFHCTLSPDHCLHPRNPTDEGISCQMASRWEIWGQAGTLGAWREGGSISPEGSRLLSSAAPGCVLEHCCGCHDLGWRTFRSQMSLCEQKAALERTVRGLSGSFISFLVLALKGADLRKTIHIKKSLDLRPNDLIFKNRSPWNSV